MSRSKKRCKYVYNRKKVNESQWKENNRWNYNGGTEPGRIWFALYECLSSGVHVMQNTCDR